MRNIKKELPKELQDMIEELEEARKKNIHFESKAMSLECELRSMEKDGIISKEQANWVKENHLYGKGWQNA